MENIADIINEDVPDCLKRAEEILLSKCAELNIPYDLQSDTSTERGYVINRKDYLDKILDIRSELPEDIVIFINGSEISDNGNCSEPYPDRRGGFLITFAQKAIIDGHWRILKPGDKNTYKMSPLQDVDARNVRKNKTIFQQGKPMSRLDEILDSKYGTYDNYYIEDQYKNPTGYHRRKQSQFRSSFNKSKTFGGISEMIETRFEPDTNLSGSPSYDGNMGDVSEMSANSNVGKQKPKPYNRRIDASDDIGPYEKPTDFINMVERTIERRSIGHVDDPALTNKQSTEDVVPDSTSSSNEPIVDDNKTNVVPDDIASRERSGDISGSGPDFVFGITGVKPRVSAMSGPVSNVAYKPSEAGAFSAGRIIKSPGVRRNSFNSSTYIRDMEA